MWMVSGCRANSKKRAQFIFPSEIKILKKTRERKKKQSTPKENPRIAIILWVALRSVPHWRAAFSLAVSYVMRCDAYTRTIWCIVCFCNILFLFFVWFDFIFLKLRFFGSLCIVFDLCMLFIPILMRCSFHDIFCVLRNVHSLIRFEECGNLIAWIIISRCIRSGASSYWICIHNGDLLVTINHCGIVR